MHHSIVKLQFTSLTCIIGHSTRSSSGYQKSCITGGGDKVCTAWAQSRWKKYWVPLLLGWASDHSLVLSNQTFTDCNSSVWSCCRFKSSCLLKNTTHQAHMLWYPLWDTHMHPPHFKFPGYQHSDNSSACPHFWLQNSQWCSNHSSFFHISFRDYAGYCIGLCIICMW